MKGSRRVISIKWVITIMFMLAITISVGGIGSMIFARWLSSAERTSESIVETISESVFNHIVDFMHEPTHINEANHSIIENNILDLSNEEIREKYFVGVLSSHEAEIYSFSFGTASGEY
ncbi:MAG: sensor domain-containing diguanylate cyclase, partial [Mesotoga sp.]|nr:sensor domain-containing diguanylate cyclase [Mesotoga sp.]